MKAFAEQIGVSCERLDSISRRLDQIHTYLAGQPCPPSAHPFPPSSVAEGVMAEISNRIDDQGMLINRLFEQIDSVEGAMAMEPTRLGDGPAKAPR